MQCGVSRLLVKLPLFVTVCRSKPDQVSGRQDSNEDDGRRNRGCSDSKPSAISSETRNNLSDYGWAGCFTVTAKTGNDQGRRAGNADK